MDILLVEDNYAEAELTRQALLEKRIDCMITSLNDGEQALQYLKREGLYTNATSPDLIFLDLMLNKIPGMVVLEEIKKDDNLKHIPVIMISGYDREAEIMDCYRMHANGYLVKTMNFEGFADMLDLVIKYWKTMHLPKNNFNHAEKGAA